MIAAVGDTTPLERAADDVTAVASPLGLEPADLAPDAGKLLGRYLVVEVVGEGGMGRVLRAYDPKLRREVAIKRVRARGRDDEAQLRLLREARAMARLSHANVVAVYDVEALDDGVALAMEFVQGGTLAQWLAATPRKVDAVLDVLVRAGEGLAAAHRVELVHRDFKPANVLVADDGRVKVTDFGLAKPIGGSTSSGDHSDSVRHVGDEVLTHAGTVMGTPRYMAPEQHSGCEADARSDQYAFGVAAWEALCGAAPFREKTLEELVRAKLRGPPAWPRAVAVPGPVSAALRRALAPDPAERWPSMGELLAEIASGRARVRNRRIGLAVGAVGLAAAAGLGAGELDRRRRLAACDDEGAEIAAVWPGRRDAVQGGVLASELPYAAVTLDKATPWLDAWARQWQAARTSACVAVEVENLLTPTLAERARTCLDLSRIRVETVVELLAQGDRDAIQGAVAALAAPTELDSCTDPSRLERVSWPARESWDTVVELRRRLARASGLQAAGRYADAQVEADAVLSAAGATGFVPLVAEARLRVGTLHELRGQYEPAESQLRAAYFEAAAAGADRVALEAAARLAFTIGHRRMRPDAGLEWGEHARVFETRLGGDEPSVSANLLNNLAAVHRARGDAAEAQRLHEQALALREEVLGPTHPDVATSLSNLALVRTDMEAYEEAADLHARALAIREEALGPEHPNVASSLDNLAAVRGVLGQRAEAKALHERALSIWERALGPDHPGVALSLSSLAQLERTMGEAAQATAHAERALSIREKALGADHPDVAMTLEILGALRWQAGAREEGYALRMRALSIRERAFGPEHRQVAASLMNLGALEADLGKPAEASAKYGRALAIWEKLVGPEHVHAAGCRLGLAEAALALGDRTEAIAQAERAIAIYARDAKSATALASAREVLGRAKAAR
jgi:tetratricopeptide (TPR) repeat protein/tRNA A-37 threonylcarbamoyl transferase component Bud32